MIGCNTTGNVQISWIKKESTKIKIIVEDGDPNISSKKLISPSSSFEDAESPACPVVVLPSSSFGKNIRLDLTGYGSSSTPVSGDR